MASYASVKENSQSSPVEFYFLIFLFFQIKVVLVQTRSPPATISTSVFTQNSDMLIYSKTIEMNPTLANNASLIVIDPNQDSDCSSGEYTTFYKSQTLVLRYTYVVNEPSCFNLTLALNFTGLDCDQIDIQKFFVSTVCSGLVTLNPNKSELTNG
jgi:hypothetical protein